MSSTTSCARNTLTWYVNFARNAMVLAYTDRSIDAATIDSTNWWRVLQKPGVRAGHSDPALDPNGYRTLIVLQLAERYYRQPGLARRLDAAMPPRYQRPKEADLTALLQAGELDYAWTYQSLAETSGLRYLSLPKAIDLSDPALARDYEAASVRIPGASRAGGDSLTFRGEPIVYALTIPIEAPHPALAAEFVRFALSAEGRAILKRNGFVLLPSPIVTGTPPTGLADDVYSQPISIRVPSMSGIPNIPHPRNEPILSYAPGTPERATLKAELARLTGEVADIPAIVGGQGDPER